MFLASWINKRNKWITSKEQIQMLDRLRVSLCEKMRINKKQTKIQQERAVKWPSFSFLSKTGRKKKGLLDYQ